MAEAEDIPAFRVKAVMLGDSGVGKTWLVKSFATNKSPNPGIPITIGVDNQKVDVERPVNGTTEKVRVVIWDTAGQEKFRTVQPMVYRSVKGHHGKDLSIACIVCYDITSRQTFEIVEFWLKQLRAHSAENVVTCLVGNKVDLAQDRVVPRQEGEAFAKANGFDYFFETSAMTGDGVSEMFLQAVDEVLARQVKDEVEAAGEPGGPSFKLRNEPSPQPPAQNQGGCRC